MFTAFAVASLINAFGELDQMCLRDAGRMWGMSLCGPTVFVDRDTRHFVARREGKITEGTLASSVPIANTAVDWDGDRWTMVILPLPEDAYKRRVLLAHESFHRIQPKLGLVSKEVPNAHLDTLQGRYLMQLEWRALAAALRGDRMALSDALAFRQRRRELFQHAAEEEEALERNEGLAEYTGTVFAAPLLRDRIPHLIEALRDAEKTPTFSRSFAYATGPAWGALREQRGVRRLAAASESSAEAPHSEDEIEKRAAKYGGFALLATERARDEKRQAILRDFRARFIDGPVLVLPLRNMQFEMNPNEAQPFESCGTIYPTLTLRDAWGSIVVKRGGALISSDWLRLIVPRPPSDDYALTLNEGWKIEGDTVVKR